MTTTTWRDCTTGQLVTTPTPSNYVQTIYTGPGNGYCFEPQGAISVTPRILNFDVIRGSNNLPNSVNITVKENSGFTHTVTVQTNPNIILINRENLTNNGNITFTISSGSTEVVTLQLTNNILQPLLGIEGTSNFYMTVNYQKI